MCNERRICDDLGHSRAYRHRGSTVAAKSTIATSLWGSGDLLILWQPSRSVQRPAHAARSPQRRCVLVRLPVGATGSIVRQRLAAKGWSAGLVTPPTCAAEQPIRTSMRRRQTACRSWSVGRSGSSAAIGASQSMPAAVSQPLSSSARPAEAGRARGRTRRTTWRRFACATFLLVREKVHISHTLRRVAAPEDGWRPAR